MILQSLHFSKKNYSWSGIHTNGSQQQGIITAFSVNLAKIHLQQQGIHVQTLKRKFCWPYWPQHRTSPTTIIVFYRQLATLLQAGVALVTALHVLLQQQIDKQFASSIITVKKALEAGHTFSASLRDCPHYFDPATCQLIHIAETAGVLDHMLFQISTYHEERWTTRKKIQQTLFYPAVIIFFAISICMILCFAVIPRFADLFAECHAELPLFTRMILQFSIAIRQYSALFVSILFILYLCHRYGQNYLRYYQWYQAIPFQIPVLKTLLTKNFAMQFARMLALQLRAGMPLTRALQLLQDLHPAPYIQHRLQRIEHHLSNGQRLYQAMQQQTLFPPLMTEMLRIGEEAGAMEPLLEKIAAIYAAELTYWLKNFSNLLEPLIIIILGALIGGLVIAMYLPIFKLGTVM